MAAHSIRRVLIIYSGGTVGLVWSDEQAGKYDGHIVRDTLNCHVSLSEYVLTPKYLESKLKTYPTLHDSDYDITPEEKKSFEPFDPITLP